MQVMCSSYFQCPESVTNSQFTYGKYNISLESSYECFEGMTVRKFKIKDDNSDEREVIMIQEQKWIDNRAPDFN